MSNATIRAHQSLTGKTEAGKNSGAKHTCKHGKAQKNNQLTLTKAPLKKHLPTVNCCGLTNFSTAISPKANFVDSPSLVAAAPSPTFLISLEKQEFSFPKFYQTILLNHAKLHLSNCVFLI